MTLPNANAAEVVLLLLDVNVKGFLLLILAFTAVACMKRSSAAARHLAWSLALGGLLFLPLLSWMLPQLKVLPRWPNASSLSTAADAGVREPSILAQYRGKILASGKFPSAKVSGQVPPTAREVSFVSQQPGPSTFTQCVIIVWLLGAGCVVVPLVAGLVSLWLLRRKSRVIASGRLFDFLHQLRRNAGCRRNVVLLTTTTRRMPMMWGMFPPAILLPQNAIEWTDERLRVVLLHELAHIQRGDFSTTLIARLACALHWFNPLVWLAVRQLSNEQEKASDDLVLRAGTAPEGYAEEVLQFASARENPDLNSFSAVAMARSSTLEGRLLAILDGTRNRASLTRAGTLIAVALVAFTLVPIAMLRAATQKAPRADGLVAWWRGDGNAKDSAGQHHGSFPFGERYSSGLSGQAFNFLRSYSINDQLGRVSIPDSPDFQLSEAMTLEAWLFPVEYGGIVLLRGDDRAGFDAWQVDLLNAGRINFHFNSADNQGAGVSAPIQLNQLQHVAAVFDRGEIKLYVNAVLLAHQHTDLRPIAVLDKNASPALGIGNAGGKYYTMPFNGIIDEVRIYNRALSEAEIEERMRN